MIRDRWMTSGWQLVNEGGAGGWWAKDGGRGEKEREKGKNKKNWGS